MKSIDSRDSNAAPKRQHGIVQGLLEDYVARGRFLTQIPQLAAASRLSELAVKRQLSRLGDRVRRLPGRSGSYVIVEPQDRPRGAPSPMAWLHDYFRARGEPYYVGLLSAAAFYGATHQAVQVTQVIVKKQLPPIRLGRVRVEFHVKSNLSDTPLGEVSGPAMVNVSSPEATALDLITYNRLLGGIPRVVELLHEMKPSFSEIGFDIAVQASKNVSDLRRLGFVLDSLGWTQYANVVREALPTRLETVALQLGNPARHNGTMQPNAWAVVDNVDVLAEEP